MDRRKFLWAGASLASSTALAAKPTTSRGNGATRKSAGTTSSTGSTTPAFGINDARRFLDQATMGARPGEADDLVGRPLMDWLDEQFAKPYTPLDHEAAFGAGHRNINGGNVVTSTGVFARWCNEDAQLRFRTTHVLQQIVVCGRMNGSVRISRHPGQSFRVIPDTVSR